MQLLHRYSDDTRQGQHNETALAKRSSSYTCYAADSTYDNAVVPLVRLQTVAVHDHHARGRHGAAVAEEGL